MIMLNKFFNSIKYLKTADFVAPFVFIILLPIAAVYKAYLWIFRRRLWLVSEGPRDARDNGFAFFSYVRKEHLEVNIYYAVDTKSIAYEKVAPYGRVVHYGGIKHWIFYIAATKNISNHKSASPNAPLFYVLHRKRLLNGHRIFLQHGVTMNNVEYLHFQETNFELFVCGAKPEYKYIRENFGYPDKRVVYLGFPRFDALHVKEESIEKRQIVIMPTWRSWLGRELNVLASKSADIKSSSYFRHYTSLINNKKLVNFIEDNNITVYFFQHANMEKFTNSFFASSMNIKIVNSENADIQSLIRDSAIMITDYSSVSIDFAYMGKPLMYYQFDESDFRENHLAEGYFSYRKDGFGPVINREEELVDELIAVFGGKIFQHDVYAERRDAFFALHDAHNSSRIFQEINKLEKGLR